MAIFEKLLQILTTHHSAVVFIPFISTIILLLFLAIYFFVYPKKTINPLLLVILIAIPPILNIFRPGTYQGGDLSLHTEVFRAFYQNLTFGIFDPRWAADFCAGHGCPVFVFTYLSPYYFGSLFHFIGFSYLDSIKIVLAVSFISSGIFMYLFMKEEFNEIAGVVSAIFYLFSPYHLIDLHFRASSGEVLSYVFIPLIFLFSRRLIIQQKISYFVLTAISVILLLYSHSVTTISVIPILIGYDLLLIRKTYKHFFNKQTIILGLSYLTGILLSVYYWFPALNEVKYNWEAYNGTPGLFAPIQEYLYSPVGYGFLFQGNQAEYRLIVGYAHFIVLIVAIYLIIVKKKLFENYEKSLLIFFLTLFLFYFFLMTIYAKPIWDNATFLNFFLMVWRLLVAIGFVTSVIAGIIVSKIKNIKFIILICFLTIVTTMLNWGNRGMVPYNPDGYFTHADEYSEYTIKGNLFYDNLYKKLSPQTDELASLKSRSKYPIEVISGNISYKIINKTPQMHEYVISVNKDAVIKENTFYFPGWKVSANNNEVSINYKNAKDIGKITFFLKKGLYDVKVVFGDSHIRSVADKISIFSLFLLLVIILLYNAQKFLEKKRK